MRGVIAEKIAGTAVRENSMTKKKQKKPVSAEHANQTEKLAERKPSKKEKGCCRAAEKRIEIKRQKFLWRCHGAGADCCDYQFCFWLCLWAGDLPLAAGGLLCFDGLLRRVDYAGGSL